MSSINEDKAQGEKPMTDLQKRIAKLEEANRRMGAGTENMVAESRAFKAAHGGFSRTQLAPRFMDRFANSNPNGGGI